VVVENMMAPKLPQARHYLNAARRGIDELVNRKHLGQPFRFFVIGISASLRAVQHALDKHDRNISSVHREMIGEWWGDQKTMTAPEWILSRHLATQS
jgi:hypothetical protein